MFFELSYSENMQLKVEDLDVDYCQQTVKITAIEANLMASAQIVR